MNATEGRSILTEDHLTKGVEALKEGQKEDFLVALYTPLFQEVLDDVNAQLELALDE